MLTSLIKIVTRRLGWKSKTNPTFVVKPYLQLGDSSDSLSLVWFSAFKKKQWSARVRPDANCEWVNVEIKAGKDKTLKVDKFVTRKFFIDLPLFIDKLISLSKASQPEYQIFLSQDLVFSSTYRIPQTLEDSKVIVFGDFGDGSSAASAIAAGVYKREPELVVLPGDLVYDHGRVSEYLRFFFPMLNADAIHKDLGAPIMRSIVTVPAAGNHDVGMPKQSDKLDAASFSDLFGYFLFWQVPNNGPLLKKETIRAMIGTKKKANQLLSNFGKSFFRKTNYSFNWKDQHWVILDANNYADWTLPELRDWLVKDLESASSKKWKFVVFHQPGFNSDNKYCNDQRMRIICPILEAGAVDVVFSGHCHFYQRHRPLYFRPEENKPREDGKVPGEFVIDYQFDGVENTLPNGVIYIVTGASGKLVNSDIKPNVEASISSSAVLIDDQHSFTELSFEDNHLLMRQISLSGEVLDSVRIDKSS